MARLRSPVAASEPFRILSDEGVNIQMISTSTIRVSVIMEATDMERAAKRIMAQLEHDIAIEGETHLKQLKPRTRMDLFLFYKECLVNISRHSGASQFSTRLTADSKRIHLTVSDNGRGILGSEGNGIPSSLKRRARLLGASVLVMFAGSGFDTHETRQAARIAAQLPGITNATIAKSGRLREVWAVFGH